MDILMDMVHLRLKVDYLLDSFWMDNHMDNVYREQRRGYLLVNY